MNMNERQQQTIQTYLRQRDAQGRVWAHIQQAQSNMAVTISKAASLFHFNESQLREWEKRGLLQTERPLLSTDGKGTTGHRQYSQTELFKLAIMRDLIDQGYSPGEIPTDLEKLWEMAAGSPISMLPNLASSSAQSAGKGQGTRQLSINARVENTDVQEFWRYFVTQALRLSLLLICEDMPDTVAGLILPLEDQKLAGSLASPSDLERAGRSLVGWLDQNRSFYLFLTDTPTFDFPTDYRLQTLKLADESMAAGDRVLDNTFIVLERNTKHSALSLELRDVVQHILGLVYARINSWEPALAHGERDSLYQIHDLARVSRIGGDRIVNALLERVIDLGGQTADGQDRWRFCSLLLPDDASLPVQQQSLIVRAQAGHAPYQIGLTSISPENGDQIDNLCLRAFEGGQIVTVPAAMPGDSMINSYRVQVITRGTQFQAPPEGETLHSALALPLVGEYGISIGVLYIEASSANAFSLHDQRVLRLIGHMLEDLLKTSQVRNQKIDWRKNILTSPMIVDTIFSEFAAETDFITEVDELLHRIQAGNLVETRGNEEVTIISVDIDNQSSIALKYGNKTARNLSQQVGVRIRGRLSFESSLRMFHISADKYYILLDGIKIENARSLATQLCEALRGNSYRVPPPSADNGKPVAQENMLELPGVTAHIGISSYTIEKLDELLKRYRSDMAVAYVRKLIQGGIEEMLDLGKHEGGNRVVSWDHESWGYKALPGT
jgi:GGDEF domain-containing protein/DNA-binding transcriptional MerR regulator